MHLCKPSGTRIDAVALIIVRTSTLFHTSAQTGTEALIGHWSNFGHPLEGTCGSISLMMNDSQPARVVVLITHSTTTELGESSDENQSPPKLNRIQGSKTVARNSENVRNAKPNTLLHRFPRAYRLLSKCNLAINNYLGEKSRIEEPFIPNPKLGTSQKQTYGNAICERIHEL